MLPIADLAGLVAPLSVAEFAALLARRDLHHFPGTPGDVDRISALLDWDGLVAVLRDESVSSDYIALTRNRVRLPEIFLRNSLTPRHDVIDRLLAKDATSIILSSAERYVPAIGRLCAAIAAGMRDRVSAVVFATNGSGGAFDLHYDRYDLVVLQVDGVKKWSFYGDPVSNPVHRMRKPPPPDATSPPVFEVVMRPGDRMFVPAGWYHRCDTQSARSLHIGILLYPFSAARAAELLLGKMLADPDARAPIRFSGSDAPSAERALRQILIDHIAATPIDDLVRLHQSIGTDEFAPAEHVTMPQASDGGGNTS